MLSASPTGFLTGILTGKDNAGQKYHPVKITVGIVLTLLFYQIEPLKNGASLILPSSIARNSSAPEAKRIFEILWGILEIIQFYPLR